MPANNFFYSFDIDFETLKIEIGVDTSYFSMNFRNHNKIKPVLTPSGNAYKLRLDNIYDGIDIVYDLTQSLIKEQIIIKNRKAAKEFFVDFEVKNASLFWNAFDRKMVVLDDKETEIFSVPLPFIKKQKRYIPKEYLNFSYGHEPDYYFKYSFNNDLISQFPVVVDPNFIFATSTVSHVGYLSDLLSNSNNMFVTGKDYGDSFIKNDMSFQDSESNVYFNLYGQTVHGVSDDVVFERDVRLIFPWVPSGVASVDMNFGGDKKHIDANISRNFVPNIEYTKANFESRFNGRRIIDFYEEPIADVSQVPEGKISFVDTFDKTISLYRIMISAALDFSSVSSEDIVIRISGATVSAFNGDYSFYSFESITDTDSLYAGVLKFYPNVVSSGNYEIFGSGITIEVLVSGAPVHTETINNNIVLGKKAEYDSEGNEISSYYFYSDSDFDFSGVKSDGLTIFLDGIQSQDLVFFDGLGNDQYGLVGSEGDTLYFRPQKSYVFAELPHPIGDAITLRLFYAANTQDQFYGYADILLPYHGSGSLDIKCNVTVPDITDKSISYRKKVSLINDIDISANSVSYIAGDGVLSIDNLLVKISSSFKPFQYIVAPFNFEKGSGESYIDGFDFYVNSKYSNTDREVVNLGFSSSLVKNPDSIEKSSSEFKTYFSLSESNLPMQIPQNNISDNFCIYSQNLTLSLENKQIVKTVFGGADAYKYSDGSVIWQDLGIIDSDLVVVSGVEIGSDLTNLICSVVGKVDNNLYFVPLFGSLSILSGTDPSIKILNVSSLISMGYSVFDYFSNNVSGSDILEYTHESVKYYSYTDLGFDFSKIFNKDSVKSIGFVEFLSLENSGHYTDIYRICSVAKNTIVFALSSVNCDDVRTYHAAGNDSSIALDVSGVIGMKMLNLANVQQGAGVVRSDLVYGGKGNLKSFVNDVEVVLKSAINNRTNVQEHNSFLKRYYYIDSEDIVGNVTIDKTGEYADIVFGIKPFCFIGVGYNLNTFSDLQSAGKIAVNEFLDKNGVFCTSFELRNNSAFFSQNLSGSYEVVFAKNENLTADLGYSILSENIFENCYMVMESDSRSYVLGIKSNSDRKIVLEGRHASKILKSYLFSVVFVNPSELYIDDAAFNSNTKYSLNFDHVDKLEGTVFYKPVKFETRNGKISEISAFLRDVGKQFSATKVVKIKG